MKRYLVLFLAGALCAGGLLWGNLPHSALLENGEVPLWEPDGLVEIADGDVPRSEPPVLDGAGGEEDPFARFTEEQRAAMYEVLDLVNQARAEAGAAPLELDPALCQAAQVRAEECVSTFSHTRPNGDSYKTALTEAGITASYVGENVATGYKGARQVVEGWLKSEGHRANILNENYTKMGVGLEKNTGSRYKGFAWAQLFIMDEPNAPA